MMAHKWCGLGQMVAVFVAGGAEDRGLIWDILFQVGPTLLFPIWGIALAVATVGYYERRRGPCGVCGRGASSKGGISNRSREWGAI
jgi:hypothetical protein